MSTSLIDQLKSAHKKLIQENKIKITNYKKNYNGYTENYTFTLHFKNNPVFTYDSYNDYIDYLNPEGRQVESIIKTTLLNVWLQVKKDTHQLPEVLIHAFLDYLAYCKSIELEHRKGIMYEDANHRYIKRFGGKILDNQTIAGKTRVQLALNQLKQNPEYKINNADYLKKLGYEL